MKNKICYMPQHWILWVIRWNITLVDEGYILILVVAWLRKQSSWTLCKRKDCKALSIWTNQLCKRTCNATCNVSSYVWTHNEPHSESANKWPSKQAREQSAIPGKRVHCPPSRWCAFRCECDTGGSEIFF